MPPSKTVPQANSDTHGVNMGEGGGVMRYNAAQSGARGVGNKDAGM